MKKTKFIIATLILTGILSCDFITDKIQQTAEDKVKEEIQKSLEDQNINVNIDSSRKMLDSILKSINSESIKMEIDSAMKELEKIQKDLNNKNN